MAVWNIVRNLLLCPTNAVHKTSVVYNKKKCVISTIFLYAQSHSYLHLFTYSLIHSIVHSLSQLYACSSEYTRTYASEQSKIKMHYFYLHINTYIITRNKSQRDLSSIRFLLSFISFHFFFFFFLLILKKSFWKRMVATKLNL